MTDFSTWLLSELEKKGWTPTELARRAGMHAATLTRILNNERNAGPDVCNAIAQALGIPPERVFRIAGLLPPFPASENDPLIKEITDMIKNLPPEKREEIARFVKFLYQEHKEAE